MARHPAASPAASSALNHHPITVLIADPNELSRSGLQALLARDPSFEIAAATALQIEVGAERLRPDLILIDPVTQGAIDQNLIAGLRHAAPSSRIVVLTNAFEPRAFTATMLQGVHGYLLKDSLARGGLLRGALAVIARFGLVVVDSSIAKEFRSGTGTTLTVRLPHAAVLTRREVEVLSLATEGLTDKEIAERLTIASRTVDFHIEHVANKLGARNRLQLGWLMQERGVL